MRRMVRFCSDKGMRTRVGRIKVDQVRKEGGGGWNRLESSSISISNEPNRKKCLFLLLL